MSHSLEEKEAGQQRDLHQHDRISSYDVEKSDDVQDADRVKNDISWSSQGLLQEGKHDGCQRGHYRPPKIDVLFSLLCEFNPGTLREMMSNSSLKGTIERK